jgi:hypothetical protein
LQWWFKQLYEICVLSNGKYFVRRNTEGVIVGASYMTYPSGDETAPFHVLPVALKILSTGTAITRYFGVAGSMK